MTAAPASWKQRVRALETEVHALYLAYRDPRTPWPARLALALLVGYALSPVDLIPDFIPVIGLLDDLVIIPLGIYFALKLVPPPVMADARSQARAAMEGKSPLRWMGLAMIALAWILITIIVIVVLTEIFKR
jgi:uncharacterized membrane protein YkvA (DUF1232 family)